jgi:hypothetical protein
VTTETLGTCENCGKDVVYSPTMIGNDPLYPVHEFSEDEDQDLLYHWGCLHSDLTENNP